MPGYLVVRIHNDSDVSDEDAQLLHTHLLHMCHLYCHVKGLETGCPQRGMYCVLIYDYFLEQ